MRTVGSLLINLERLTGRPSLLGARWTFAFPDAARRAELTELSLPFHPDGFLATLERRTGLRVHAHQADGLYDALARGIAAIAVVDSFHLPYRPAFGRVHSHRTIVVRALGREHVEADDLWPPAFRGPLAIEDFERARFSDVPLDPIREPIFAGRPIAGEWFQVEDGQSCLSSFESAASLLAELHAEATSELHAGGIAYGEHALGTLIDAIAHDAIHPREASLLLRTELGARVYLCAFLRAAAQPLGDRSLAQNACAYSEQLRAMELARDVLAKSLAHPGRHLIHFVLDRLREARDGERRLIDHLARWSIRERIA
ncbi:MAG TPA: BtrH N-terminal domain-containing protein [Thermoanaerobaculia bacterium]|nr:BtrH N-terminal domain-containing protein [Thermoanaerobaculia bacterium]